jgi:16S rRNA G966 N2-methylase RsmD
MDLFGNEIKIELSLADKYLMCPTSVLNTRDPKWSQLSKKWKKLGIQSELGRENTKNKSNDFERMASYFKGTAKTEASIFDPVICEIIYKWFGKCNILDPFAGGSVRGIVAHKLGFNYTGIEIRQEQIDSNREQALNILEVNNQPQWYLGDSEIILDELIPKYDLVFSCPPYMNLEVYSDLENDLSNMNDEKFIIKYKKIIKKSCDKLKKGGYAVFVVGDLRDNKGFYKDFTGITKQAFYESGMKLYNELILLKHLGTKVITLEKGFKNGKLAKVHENIYIFYKP